MQGRKYFLAVKTASPVECGDLKTEAALYIFLIFSIWPSKISRPRPWPGLRGVIVENLDNKLGLGAGPGCPHTLTWRE